MYVLKPWLNMILSAFLLLMSMSTLLAEIKLPLVVDDYYAASGYRADAEIPGVVSDLTCSRRAGEQKGRCHAFTWKPSSERAWAAVEWISHTNQKRVIAEGATHIRFYAWGEQGGERISLKAGIAPLDGFEVRPPSIVLEKEPKKYLIPIDDIGYESGVLSPFAWIADRPLHQPLKFYIDDIQWLSLQTDEQDVWPVIEVPDNGAAIRVRNHCPMDLWVRADSPVDGRLGPEYVYLRNNEDFTFLSPGFWRSGRVTAFKDGPGQNEIEKAEMTIEQRDGKTLVNFNLTYVDHVGLPMSAEAVGGACNRASHSVACKIPLAEILNGCPHDFLMENGRCLSPRSFCDPGRPENATHPYCHALDAAIQSCPSCPGGTTWNVYACSGPYAERPVECAALNRGLRNLNERDVRKFYQQPPYNTYAKWSQSNCPGIYSFPYDDSGDQGGFRVCQGKEIRLSFCPAD